MPNDLPRDMDSGTATRPREGFSCCAAKRNRGSSAPKRPHKLHPVRQTALIHPEWQADGWLTGEDTESGDRRKTALGMHVPDALGAPSFLECHRIEILTVTPDFSLSNIPYMGVWKIGAFVRCAVNASKTAQRDDS
jgi:hypothetical protein